MLNIAPVPSQVNPLPFKVNDQLNTEDILAHASELLRCASARLTNAATASKEASATWRFPSCIWCKWPVPCSYASGHPVLRH